MGSLSSPPPGVPDAAIQWGDIGTWVGAIGTVLAVVVALSLTLRQRRLERVNEEQKQAAKIAAWLDVDVIVGRPEVRLLVRNSSDASISLFRAHIRDRTQPSAPPTTIEINGVPPTGVPLVRATGLRLPPHTEDLVYWVDAIEFRDFRFRRWELGQKGLRQLKKAENT